MSFGGGDNAFTKTMEDQMPPEALEQMRAVAERFTKVAELLDSDRIHLPFTVVHAHRAD